MKDLATKRDIALTRQHLVAKFKEFEWRLTIKIGLMMFFATCLILAKLKAAL
ncbi:hypothetical protein [Fluviibacter phosphoraccumulans]|uniref:hypothetical protein n=1 Tax=Fluviibacter phosphoraccumulans TaxID=1751046 RepID=UPI0010B39726|nr:hypothetical protein [Fluviibacter phosphoraccumulans]